jgi:quinohemoprotein ethanol dehydrogenase
MTPRPAAGLALLHRAGRSSLPPEDEAMAMALKTWSGNGWVKWGGGGTAWDSMAYDPELNQLYIGVGNGSPFNYKFRSDGKGDNLFLSSIVALARHRQVHLALPDHAGREWDYTATQHMILADLTIEGKKRKVLMQAPKNGFFYVLDRTNGQLLSAEKFVPVNWASHIDKATGRRSRRGRRLPGRQGHEDRGAQLPGRPQLAAHVLHPGTGLVYLPAQETRPGGPQEADVHAHPQRGEHRSGCAAVA